MQNNYTIGRGEAHFAAFLPSTQTPEPGESYLGNTPGFGLTVTRDELPHYSSDHGIQEKDASADLRVNRSGKMDCDNISAPNIARWTFGTATILDNVTPDNVVAEPHNDVRVDTYLQLGVSDSAPSGAKGVSAVVVKDDGSPQDTFTAGTDYTVDLVTGRVYIVDGGTIVDGTNLRIDYTVDATHRDVIVSGNTPIEGTLRIISDNPVGENRDWFFPWVKLTPNGDFNLKGDNWQSMPFTVEVLKKTNRAAMYIDGRPVANS